MAREVTLGVVGATGAVGREMIRVLEETRLTPKKIRLFASERSAGATLPFRGEELLVEQAELETMAQCSHLLMSAGGNFSQDMASRLADQGCFVIDNSSAWRMVDSVPLVVPEVNGQILEGSKPGIIANPNCSTIQMVVALKPLADRFGLRRVMVATYQSVSGTGHKGIAELRHQHHELANGRSAVAEVYDRPIAFNCLPYIGAVDSQGYCEEEVKMVRETRKILGLPDLELLPTTVRVPVEYCHGEVVTVEMQEPADISAVLAALSKQEGLEVETVLNRQTTPVALNVKGRNGVFVSRVRLPYQQDVSTLIQFWNIADNLRKGAATNAVQILERLLKSR